MSSRIVHQKLGLSYNVYISIFACVSYTCTITNTLAKLAKPQTFGFRFELCQVRKPATSAVTTSEAFHGIIPYSQLSVRYHLFIRQRTACLIESVVK